MATDLRKVGLEGFALIDKLYGPARRTSSTANNAIPAREGRWVVQVPNDEMEEPPITGKEAAARYGGLMIVNFPKQKGKPQARFGRSLIKA